MDFKKIKGGKFLMGSSVLMGHPTDLETPAQEVIVEEFLCATTTVTNEQFQEFVETTGYVTQAEQKGYSLVFHLLIDTIDESWRIPNSSWWLKVPKANWRCPEGEGSSIVNRMNHPVTHVSRRDAIAFCQWSGTRLLTEAEWEFAARAGTTTVFPWGDDLLPESGWCCNVWQGDFPMTNTLEDGYLGTAPVKNYLPNSNGLYQMIGNVWEWCSNPRYQPFSMFNRLTGSAMWRAYSGIHEGQFAIRGGSFLCHESYCRRYRVAARNGQEAYVTSSNVGFRCARDLVEGE